MSGSQQGKGGGMGLAEPGQAMRFGVLGGDDALAEALAGIPGLQVARRAPADAPAEVWRQVVNPTLIDALVIDVAPAWRSSMIQDALAVGVPVLCVGAIATDATEMSLVKRLSGMGGGLVMGWYPWLFDPAFAAISEIGGMVGPVRAVRAEVAIPDPLRGAELVWAAGADAVAGCLELLGGPPEQCSAEDDGASGVLLRLVFKDDVTAHVRLVGGRPAAFGFAVHHDSVVLRATSTGGLRLHPPTPGFGPPADAGEPIADVAPRDLETALRTFAHMILEQEPQPQILDFAADVVGVLDRCAKDL